MMNTPVRSRCDKCWQIRPGWVERATRFYPYRRRGRLRSHSVPCSPHPASSDDVGSYSDCEVLSNTRRVKSLRELAQNACIFLPGPTEESTEEEIPTGGRRNTDVNKAVPGQRTGRCITSTSEESTVIINSSDEEELIEKVVSFENEARPLQSLWDDSGLSETLFSSQGSVTEAVTKMGVTDDNPAVAKQQGECEAEVSSTPLETESVMSPERHHETHQFSPVELGNNTAVAAAPPPSPDMCALCESRPKNASLVHGKSGHQVCCFPCGVKLRQRKQPCPVCRKPIQKVIKNYPA